MTPMRLPAPAAAPTTMYSAVFLDAGAGGGGTTVDAACTRTHVDDDASLVKPAAQVVHDVPA